MTLRFSLPLISSVTLHGIALISYGAWVAYADFQPARIMQEPGVSVLQATLVPSASSRAADHPERTVRDRIARLMPEETRREPEKSVIIKTPEDTRATVPMSPGAIPLRTESSTFLPQVPRQEDDVASSMRRLNPAEPVLHSPNAGANRVNAQAQDGDIRTKGVMASATARHVPRPEYPRRSREQGEEGSVDLTVDIDAEGRPVDIRILRSSGYPRLDRAAHDAARRARFSPAYSRGNPVASSKKLRFTFSLEAYELD